MKKAYIKDSSETVRQLCSLKLNLEPTTRLFSVDKIEKNTRSLNEEKKKWKKRRIDLAAE